MGDHLKPAEFIHALEKAGLSARAAAHLADCAHCRDVIHDLRSARRVLRPIEDSEGLPDDAFWKDFTRTVHAAIEQQVARPRTIWRANSMPRSWHSVAASALMFLLVALFFGTPGRDLPRNTVETRGGLQSASDSTRNDPTDMAEGNASGVDFLDVDPYLYTEARFYDQLQQELSFLHLGPEAMLDGDVGLSRYLDY